VTEFSKGKALGREGLACNAPRCGQHFAIDSPERARLVQPAPRCHNRSGSVWPISGRTFLSPKPAEYPLSIVPN